MAASPAWLKMPQALSASASPATDDIHRQGSPSAKTATWAAWAAVEIPIPTQTGSWVVALRRSTSELAAVLTLSRIPVTPISEEA